ncbi:alginate export family protein [Cesiribacter sp. SM1]|uniref:alginate export family protein n=1 Tax=Cesiribacter sp. SM1 TaxID=2861196 RepID=UPI001CD6935D|nr:alginate export family protein [Cesiribacter sp. SM1]
MKTYIVSGMLGLACLFANTAQAQFSVDGQLVQRAEYRHGYGKLISENDEAAAFIGQRARLNAQYKMDKFSFYVSVQDVRTWGSAPQIKATDPYLSVHEAWAETRLGDHFSLKLGRQELNYDNARFLGNLDWALQGRAHDFALAKWEKDNMKLHFGAGYNQDAEKLSGRLFTTPNQYKTAQFVRFENGRGNFSYSALFWNNGRQYVVTDDLNQVVDEGIRYMQTLGLPTLKYQLKNTIISGFYYQQLGKDVAGRKVRAFDASAQVSHALDLNPDKGRKLRLTAGVEFLSGTDNNSSDNINRSFAPLYGTNHAHNGYMDQFFVGGRHDNTVGLQDLFLRVRYDVNNKLFTSLNGHSFSAFADVYNEQVKSDSGLGYELDFSLGYLINDAVSLQSGYSQLFASDTFKMLQGVQNPDRNQNWAYLMMIYRPTMKNKFIGLLF